MLSLRYSAGKIWANFAVAIVGGLVLVVIIGALWKGALVGGLSGIVGVGVMLGIGCVKRSGLREPIVVVDERGITIGLPKFGTIPWAAIRSAEVRGIPWVTSARLVIDYEGQAVKASFGDKLYWIVQTRQIGPRARLSIGCMELTDQPISALKSAINQANPGRAT